MLAASQTLLQRVQPVPLMVGRKAAVQALDARIGRALSQVESANWHLNRLPRPAGDPGTLGLEQVTSAIDELAHGLRTAAVESRPRARYHEYAGMREHAMLAGDLGAGLKGLGADNFYGWLDQPLGVSYGDRSAALRNRHAIVSMSPEWRATLEGWVPSSADDGAWRAAREPLRFMLDVEPAAAPRLGMWRLAQQHWSYPGAVLDADDLRSMVRTLGAPWEPPWLADLSGKVKLDRERVADLVVASDLVRKDRRLDLQAAHYLVNEWRTSLGRGVDTGHDIVSSMRRLPDSLRPDIPIGVEDDLDAALAWARDVRSRSAREFVTDRPVDEPLLVALLDNDELGQLGRVQVARELLEQVPAGSEQHAIARGAFDDLAASFLERNERSWHIESTDFGRVRAAARLLARIAELDAAGAKPAVASTAAVTW